MLKFTKLQVPQDVQSDDQQVSGNGQDTPMPTTIEPTTKKEVRSEKQREASRRNGSRSRGPYDTQRTRFNALKHGFRAQGLTPWDDAQEYEQNLYTLETIYPSSNPFDELLREQSALEMVRLRRMDRLEADNITEMSSRSENLDDPDSRGGTPTIHFTVIKEYAGPVLDTLQRNKTATMNRLLRNRRELERIPRDETKADLDGGEGHGVN